MGILCPCGVSVNAFSKKNRVELRGKCGTIRGDLTYLADVCVTTLGKSTLSLKFVDTGRPSVNDFLFTANDITSVVCQKEKLGCSVTVRGTGIVNGKQYPFTAVFEDHVFPGHDSVRSFVITGFFDQNGAVFVPQGSITAIGCQQL
ncbi:hypothetical protein MHZ95_03895 [Sporosarcina sp. ACRSM]|uniref:hypothetical protein n=1 Tax=Sporosarcina sp. ACRSM TaxID=2918216 RepID=UPI001EF50071|nr:hypothetical protein [Sporosarcina sp. ACRSM]MCG7334422.1 hypothetical protein [Sporosarcina sp. ACRSM]